MTGTAAKFVIATAVDATDEAAEIKTIIQIFERVLFCIALISSLNTNTEHSSVQPEI